MAIEQARAIAQAMVAIAKPQPKLTISQWADEFRYIARGTGPEPGRWRTSRAPYSQEIMDEFNRDCNLVVFMAGSQVGKTEIALNFMGYYIHQDPSPIMYLLPNDGLSEDFSKTRIQKTIDDTPVLSKLFSNKSRDGDNTISLKNFTGGYLTIHGATTPGKLASKAIRTLLADEIDRFPREIKGEGNPLLLALQRTTNFSNKKIFLISTPTVKGDSQIEEWFERTDKRYYYVPCPDCGHEFVLNWAQMRWEKDENNEPIDESVHLECPACFYHITDRHKSEMLAAGKWVKTQPHKKITGFHISSLYSPWLKFRELVAEFHEATKTRDRKKLREFINLKLGESFEEDYSEIDVGELESHREDYPAAVPDKVLVLTCAVDVQDNRFEIQFTGWGVGEESWVIKYYKLFGDLTSTVFWQELETHIFQSFNYADGTPIMADCIVIDSGGHFTQEVYKFVKQLQLAKRTIYSIKGSNQLGGVPVVGKYSKVGRQQVMNFMIGVHNAKDVIHHRLRNNFVGAGFMHFPRNPDMNCDQSYFEMLLSEHKVKRKTSRGYIDVWEKIYPSARNEALDLTVYNLAALRIRNPPLEYLAKINHKRLQNSAVENLKQSIADHPQLAGLVENSEPQPVQDAVPLTSRVPPVKRRRRTLSRGINFD